jgi:hypothetical protein
VHQGGVSFYVKIVDLISLRHQSKWWSSKLPRYIPTWTWLK